MLNHCWPHPHQPPPSQNALPSPKREKALKPQKPTGWSKWKFNFTIDKYTLWIYYSTCKKSIDSLPLSLSPMLSLPSHQRGKQREVGGQQALKMLIIHTAAKRQRAKGAGSHYQAPCMCVGVWWNGVVFFFCEMSLKLLLRNKNSDYLTFKHTQPHRDTPSSPCLSETLTTASVPAKRGGLSPRL